MKNIKNLLFDLGGVIMDIRKENCIKAFERLGLQGASEYFGDFSQKGPFYGLERGDISAKEFHEVLHNLLPPHVTDSDIDSALCKFLIGIPPKRLEALEMLRKRFRIYMLSNTNPIMWNSKIKDDFTVLGKDMDYYFDGIITSFNAHALKPEPKIFEFTIQELGIYPEETLFLDDSQLNIEAAGNLGFRTAHVANGLDFTDILKSLNI